MDIFSSLLSIPFLFDEARTSDGDDAQEKAQEEKLALRLCSIEHRVEAKEESNIHQEISQNGVLVTHLLEAGSSHKEFFLAF